MPKILKEVYMKKTQAMEKLLNIRITEQERAMLKAKAEKYTGGNVSAYIKIACRDFEPKKGELIDIKK